MHDTPKEIPGIPIETLQWRPTGPADDPRARLLAPIKIGTQMMHLEAIAVTENEATGIKSADWHELAPDPEAFENAQGCAFSTTAIDGRDYVFIATPYGK